MIYREMNVQAAYEKAGAVHGKYQPRLIGYLHSDSEELKMSGKRAAVIICPGGAYQFKSDREAEPVAMRFMAAGMQAFVLQYSVAPSRYPCAVLELAESVAMVREHAGEWGIDPEKIFICGFSAGGHLCATLGTLWKDEIFQQAFGTGNFSYKPSGMILCYPVITMGEFTHKESCANLTGPDGSPKLREKLSLEKQVTADTLPTFIWHTQEDDAVPAENTLLFTCALRKYRVPFELHIYERGGHGLSLCDETTASNQDQIVLDNAGWMEHAVRWLKRF